MTLHEKLRQWWEEEDFSIIALTVLTLVFLLVSIILFAAVAATALIGAIQ